MLQGEGDQSVSGVEGVVVVGVRKDERAATHKEGTLKSGLSSLQIERFFFSHLFPKSVQKKPGGTSKVSLLYNHP